MCRFAVNVDEVKHGHQREILRLKIFDRPRVAATAWSGPVGDESDRREGDRGCAVQQRGSVPPTVGPICQDPAGSQGILLSAVPA